MKWTVRAKCFKKIQNNYNRLISLWILSLREKMKPELRARIHGVLTQMKTFKFFFGLALAQRLYALSDNLSTTLQKEKMSALDGKRTAGLTVLTIKGMRSEEQFDLFYDTVVCKASKKKPVGQPVLPRRRN